MKLSIKFKPISENILWFKIEFFIPIKVFKGLFMAFCRRFCSIESVFHSILFGRPDFLIRSKVNINNFKSHLFLKEGILIFCI